MMNQQTLSKKCLNTFKLAESRTFLTIILSTGAT